MIISKVDTIQFGIGVPMSRAFEVLSHRPWLFNRHCVLLLCADTNHVDGGDVPNPLPALDIRAVDGSGVICTSRHAHDYWASLSVQASIICRVLTRFFWPQTNYVQERHSWLWSFLFEVVKSSLNLRNFDEVCYSKIRIKKSRPSARFYAVS